MDREVLCDGGTPCLSLPGQGPGATGLPGPLREIMRGKDG